MTTSQAIDPFVLCCFRILYPISTFNVVHTFYLPFPYGFDERSYDTSSCNTSTPAFFPFQNINIFFYKNHIPIASSFPTVSLLAVQFLNKQTGNLNFPTVSLLTVQFLNRRTGNLNVSNCRSFPTYSRFTRDHLVSCRWCPSEVDVHPPHKGWKCAGIRGCVFPPKNVVRSSVL